MCPIFLIFLILVPGTVVSHLLLKTDTPACEVASIGLQTVFQVLSSNELENTNTRLMLFADAAIWVNRTFYDCLNHTELTSSGIVPNVFDKFGNLYDVLAHLLQYAKTNKKSTVAAVISFVKALKSRDFEKAFTAALSSIQGVLLTKTGSSIPRKLHENADPTPTNFVLNFLMYSGSLSTTFPSYCISSLDEMLQTLWGPLYDFYTLRALHTPLRKLFALPQQFKSFMADCAHPLAESWKSLLHPTSWVQHIFANLNVNFDAIKTNVENTEFALAEKDWNKAGAWVGLLLYNIVFDNHNEHSFLDAKIVAQAAKQH